MSLPDHSLSTPQPLPTPQWLQDRQRFVFLNERQIGVIDPADAAQMGADIVSGATNAGYLGTFSGPFVWDGKDTIYNMWTNQPIDQAALRGVVDRAHASGLKVIGEMMRMWHPQVLCLEHPEWQQKVTPDAQPWLADKVAQWPPVTGCWNSGFGDFYIRQNVEFIKRLDWDGFSLDGFGCWATCYCDACRESYRSATGKEIPFKSEPIEGQPGMQTVATMDLNDVEFRKYLKWRLGHFTRFVDKWARAVHEAKPDFACIPWTNGPGRWWHWAFVPSAEGSDASNRLMTPLLELFWDFPPDQGSNLLPSFTVRYHRGLAAERPVFMLPYFCTQGQQAMVAPPVEADFRVLSVLTNGGRVALSSHQTARIPGQMQHHLDLIKEREEWTTPAKSMKWAAMVISESSRLLYGMPGQRVGVGAGAWIGSGVDTPDASQIPAGERRLPAHMESSIGVFRAAIEERLPIDMITEEDVEDAERLGLYQVVILANAACLSDKALQSIRHFVENGGGLVAMHQSTYCDEFGTPREDFGLKDLFGASFVATENHTAAFPSYPNPINVRLTDHQITTDQVIEENYRVEMKTLDFLVYTTRVKAQPGGSVIAELGQDPGASDQINQGPKAVVDRDVFKDAHPFIIVSNHGKGRVVYFAADIGQSYFVIPYQYERKLIANSMKWAARETPLVSVDAPMCVQTAFYEIKERGEYVVHLLNEVNTTANRALPEANSSMREEILPISNIRVCFRDIRISEVYLEPGHEALPMALSERGMEVVVPRLDLHAMVVAKVSK